VPNDPEPRRAERQALVSDGTVQLALGGLHCVFDGDGERSDE
jgi:hypothetical protein